MSRIPKAFRITSVGMAIAGTAPMAVMFAAFWELLVLIGRSDELFWRYP
jgi:hypothetical protein